MGFWYYCQEYCCGRRLYAWRPSASPRQYGGAENKHVPSYVSLSDHNSFSDRSVGGDTRHFAPLPGRPHSIDRQSDGWVLLKDGYGIKDDGSLWRWTDGGRVEFFDAGPWTWVSAKDGFAVGIKQDTTLWSWSSESPYSFPFLGNGEISSWGIEPIRPAFFFWNDQTRARVKIDCKIDSVEVFNDHYRYSPLGLKLSLDSELENYGQEATFIPTVNGEVFFVELPEASVPVSVFPEVSFDPPGARATPILDELGKLSHVRIEDGGTYSYPPSVKIKTGEDSYINAIAHVEGPVSVGIKAGEEGSGYTTASKLWLNVSATCDPPTAAGRIYKVTLENGGQGYFRSFVPSVSFSNYGQGSGAEAVASVNQNGGVVSVTVTKQGEGYWEPYSPTVSIEGTGKDAAAVAYVDASGVVTQVRIVNPGRGYSDVGTKAVFSPPGAEAQLIVSGGRVTGAVVPEGGGHQYRRAKPPAVVFDPPGATAVAKVGPDFKIDSVEVVSSGTYLEPHPPVVTAGGGGDGAKFSCSVTSNGVIESVEIVAPGSGYFGYEELDTIYIASDLGYYGAKVPLSFAPEPGAMGSGASGFAEVIASERYKINPLCGDYSVIGEVRLHPGSLSSIYLPRPIPIFDSDSGNKITGASGTEKFHLADWRVSDYPGGVQPPQLSISSCGHAYQDRICYDRTFSIQVTNKGSGYETDKVTVLLSGGEGDDAPPWHLIKATAGLGDNVYKNSPYLPSDKVGVHSVTIESPPPSDKFAGVLTAVQVPPSELQTSPTPSVVVLKNDREPPEIVASPTSGGSAVFSVSLSKFTLPLQEGESEEDAVDAWTVSSISVLSGAGSSSGPVSITARSGVMISPAKCHSHTVREAPAFSYRVYTENGYGLCMAPLRSVMPSPDPHWQSCTAPRQNSWYCSSFEIYNGGFGYQNGEQIEILLGGSTTGRPVAGSLVQDGGPSVGVGTLSVDANGTVTSVQVNSSPIGYVSTTEIESVAVDDGGAYFAYSISKTKWGLPSVEISEPTGKDGEQASAVAVWTSPEITFEHDVSGAEQAPVLEGKALVRVGNGYAIRHYYRFPHTGTTGPLPTFQTIKETTTPLPRTKLDIPLLFTLEGYVTQEAEPYETTYTYKVDVQGDIPVGPEFTSVDDEVVIDKIGYDGPGATWDDPGIEFSVLSPPTVSFSMGFNGGSVTQESPGYITTKAYLGGMPGDSFGPQLWYDAYANIVVSSYLSHVRQYAAAGQYRPQCKAIHKAAFALPDRDPPGQMAVPATIEAVHEVKNGYAYVSQFDIKSGGSGYTYEPEITYDAAGRIYVGDGQAVRAIDRPVQVAKGTSLETGWTNAEVIDASGIVAAINGGNVYWWGRQDGVLSGSTSYLQGCRQGGAAWYGLSMVSGLSIPYSVRFGGSGYLPVATQPLPLGSAIQVETDAVANVLGDGPWSGGWPNLLKLPYPSAYGIMPVRASGAYLAYMLGYANSFWNEYHMVGYSGEGVFAPGSSLTKTAPIGIYTGASYGYFSDTEITLFSANGSSYGHTAKLVGPSGNALKIVRCSTKLADRPSVFAVLCSDGKAWTLGGWEGFNSGGVIIPRKNILLTQGDPPQTQVATEYRYAISLAAGGSGHSPGSKAKLSYSGYTTKYNAETELAEFTTYPITQDIPVMVSPGGRLDWNPFVVLSASEPTVSIEPPEGAASGSGESFVVSQIRTEDQFTSGWRTVGEPWPEVTLSWSDIHPPLIGLSSIGPRRTVGYRSSSPAGIQCDGFISLAPALGNSGVITASKADGSIWATDSATSCIQNELELTVTKAGGGMILPPLGSIKRAESSTSGTVEAHINGKVVAIGVLEKGSGYGVRPSVSFIPSFSPFAEQAANPTAIAHICGGITGVKIEAAGGGYSSPPKVKFSRPGMPASVSLGMKGFVNKIHLSDRGSRYTEPPAVTIFGDGEGAKATATISGFVDEIVVTKGGSGYSSAPKVVMEPDGCKAVAIIREGAVDSVLITEHGYGYTSAPKVSFEGGGPTVVAEAKAVLNAGVSSITLEEPGSGYSYTPTVQIYPESATASCELSLWADSVSVHESGRYFNTPPTITVEPDWCVSKINITSGGQKYQEAPEVLIVGGSGTGASASCQIHGPVSKIAVLDGGVGYSEDFPPHVVIEGGLDPVVGVKAKATAIISEGRISGFSVISGGSGYTSPPTISLRFPAAASAVSEIVDGKVAAIRLINSGAFYEAPPRIEITGGSPKRPAAAYAAVEDGSVSAIQIGDAGEGYVSAPDVYIVYDSYGEGARAAASINGVVDSITVTDRGRGYVLPPEVLFVGGAGDGAAASPVTSQMGGGAQMSCKISGRVEYIELKSHGAGHDYPPAVVISAPDLEGGTKARAQARILGRINKFDVKDSGSGYQSPLAVANLHGFGYGDSELDFYSSGGWYYGYGGETLSRHTSHLMTSGGGVTSIPISLPPVDFVQRPQVYLEDEISARAIVSMSLSAFGVDHLGSSLTGSAKSIVDQSTSRHARALYPPETIGNTARQVVTAVLSSVPGDNTSGWRQKDGRRSLASIVITDGGSGYTSAPTVKFGSSSEAVNITGTTVVSGGQVVSATITSGALVDDNFLATNNPGRSVTFVGGNPEKHATGYLTFAFDETVRKIDRIIVTDGGRGYQSSSPPAVSVSPGPATAQAVVSSAGEVSSVFLTANGYYSSPPVLTIAPPSGAAGGRQAKAEAAIGGSVDVSSLAVRPGHELPVDISLSLRGTVEHSSHKIGNIWLANDSKYDLPPPEIVIENERGIGALATVSGLTDTSKQPILSVSGGYDYTNRYLDGDPYISLNGGVSLAYKDKATAAAVVSGGQVTQVNVINGGTWVYKSEPAVYISGGGGSGASATAMVEGGKITSIRVESGGGGYTSTPTVTIVDKNPYYEKIDLTSLRNAVPQGSGWIENRYPHIVGCSVDFAEIDAGGRPTDAEAILPYGVIQREPGYIGELNASFPQIAGITLHPFFEDGSIVDARIVHDMSDGRRSKALSVQHISPPQVKFEYTIPYSLGGIKAVNVTEGGSGYTTPPTVIFSGGGCEGYAVVASGAVRQVVVTNPGSGLAAPPEVTFSYGSAKAEAVLETPPPVVPEAKTHIVKWHPPVSDGVAIRDEESESQY